ncbi:hypothetical protein ABZ686_02335 [Streptomyces sp. NPDC006992]|uniref:zinc finger domain-containing protein n=1 Tax=Streptomyces sp. NPDC006992 TaxID=3155601 RepID=UPI0033CB60DD
MTTPPPAARLPQIAVGCPRCGAAAGALCTSHGGARVRRNDTHVGRRAAWVAAGRPDTSSPGRSAAAAFEKGR